MFTAALLKLRKLPVYPIPVQLCGQRQITLSRSGILKKITRVRARKKNCFRICSFRQAVNSFHSKKGSQDHTCPESLGESNQKATTLQKKTEEFMNLITHPEVQKKVADLITVLKKQLVIPSASVSKSDKAIQRKGVTKQSSLKKASNKTLYQINQEIQNIQPFEKTNPEIYTTTSVKKTVNNTEMLSDCAALTTASFAPNSTNDDFGHRRNDLTGGAVHWRLLSEKNVDATFIPKPTESSEHYVKPDPRVQYPQKPMFTRRSITAAEMRSRIKEEQMKLGIGPNIKDDNYISNNLNSMSHGIDQSENEKVETKNTANDNSHVSLLNKSMVNQTVIGEHDTIHDPSIKQDSTLMDTKQNEDNINEEPMLFKKMSSTAANIEKRIQEQKRENDNTSCKLDSTSTDAEQTKEDNPKLEEQTKGDCHVPLLNKSVLYTSGSNTEETDQKKQKTTEKTGGNLVSTSTEISDKQKKDLNVQLFKKAMLNSAHIKSNMKVSMPEEETKNRNHKFDSASAKITDSEDITINKNSPDTNNIFKRELPENSCSPKVTNLASSSKSDEISLAKRIPLYNQPKSAKRTIDEEPTDRPILLTSNDQQEKINPIQHEIEQEPIDGSLLTSNDKQESRRQNYENFVHDMKTLLTKKQEASSEKKRTHPRLLASSQAEETNIQYHGGNTMYNGTYGDSYYPDEMPYYWSFENTSNHNVPKSSAKDNPTKNSLYQEINPLEQLWAQGFLLGQKLTPMSSRLEVNYNTPLFNIQSSTFVPEQNSGNLNLQNSISDSQIYQRNNYCDFMDTSQMKSHYPPQKCLTTAEMLEYAKLNQTPQTFLPCPNLPMAQPSLPSQPMQSVTGSLGSSVMPGVPVQGMYGLTGHEMLSSPGQIMPGSPTQGAVGYQGLVTPSLPGSVVPGLPAQVTPGYPTQEMIGSPGYALTAYPGLVTPGLLRQDISGLPANVALGLPIQETSGVQGSIIPGLPGQVIPGSPGQLLPGLPGHAMPGLPGQAMSGLPGQSMPGVPGQAMPGLPGQAMPSLPGQVRPGVPGQVIPGLVGRESGDLQRQVMTGLPAQEVLILPEQPSYYVQGQTSPSLPVQIIPSFPDVAVPTVPAFAQQSVMLSPGQIVYSVPNSFPCPNTLYSMPTNPTI